MKMKNGIASIICLFLLNGAAEGAIPNEVLKKIEEHVVENSWPSIYYDVLPKVIREYDFKNLVEVGVALGGHAETILQNTHLSNYYGIDPYQSYDPNDGFDRDVGKYSSEGTQASFNYLFEWVQNRLSPFGNRCQLIRKPSVLASSDFEDGSLDCIFIDGDHRYHAVMEDLKSWFPKLKPGGLILGDDYWMDDVKKAVNRFFALKGYPVFFYVAESGYEIWAVKKS
jgi:hypothetical protein